MSMTAMTATIGTAAAMGKATFAALTAESCTNLLACDSHH